jgi:eukaryotic-like serine/threonine-protein kinase
MESAGSISDALNMERRAEEFKYWAFLSYSRSDQKWADWLHRALETYRVPKKLIGTPSRDGGVPARLFPVFFDRKEFAASADLGTSINEALRLSRYLIVICSPRAAESRWVNEEVMAFKRLGREQRVLALIIEGEPNASGPESNEGSPRRECFPKALRYRLGPDGECGAEHAEPLAADARPTGDGRAEAKIKLLAGLLDIEYDDLKEREQRRRIRGLQIVSGAALTLLTIFGLLGIGLYLQKTEADRQRLSAQSAKTIAQAERDKAVASRRAADELIRYMQYELSDTLKEVGRLDLLDGINTRIVRYHHEHPPEPGDDVAMANAERERAAALLQEGSIFLAKNDLDSARSRFRKVVAISERLSAQDPSNVHWQRDLSVSYRAIGDVQKGQNDIPGALKSYLKGLEVSKSLAARNEDNLPLQGDLAETLDVVGETQLLAGDTSSAIECFRESQAISERLLKREPDNADWQRDVAVGDIKLGDIAEEGGDLSVANKHYLNSVMLTKSIASRFPDDWMRQRDLMAAHNRLGKLQKKQRDYEGAAVSYGMALAITEQLAKRDPDNARWQSDLAMSCGNVATVKDIQDQFHESLEYLRRTIAIYEKLWAQDPSNAEWQGELGFAYGQAGDTQARAEPAKKQEALAMLERGRSLLLQLRESNGLTARQQQYLEMIERRLRR